MPTRVDRWNDSDESRTRERNAARRAMSKDPLKPGNEAPRSGQYREVGPRGGEGREVTVVKGEPLPPTTQRGSTYRLVDATKNKSGRE